MEHENALTAHMPVFVTTSEQKPLNRLFLEHECNKITDSRNVEAADLWVRTSGEGQQSNLWDGTKDSGLWFRLNLNAFTRGTK